MRVAAQTLPQMPVRRVAPATLQVPKREPAPRSQARTEATPRGLKELAVDTGSAALIWIGDLDPALASLGHKVYGYMTRSIDGPPLQKLGSLGPTIMRGAQPTDEGFEQLASQGVKTVINLRPENNAERELVERLGMKAVYLPLPPLDAPTHAQTLAFLKTALDPKNGKVFFHCYHGVDRTGIMAAALRIARDGWSSDKAIAELRSFGFHEAGQKAKLRYVKEFESFWKGLSPAQKAEVLHLPLAALKPRLEKPLVA